MSLVNKTLEAYEKHGSIIVGVDFDDTVFASDMSDQENMARCSLVADLLRILKSNYSVIICMFSVADKQTLRYKWWIMRQIGLQPDYVNESPVKHWGDCSKPYFNIYLDDKSGLNEMIEVLKELNNK